MSVISVGCELSYEALTPTIFFLNVSAAEMPPQRIVDEVFFTGCEKNRLFRFTLNPHQWHFGYAAPIVFHPRVEAVLPQDTGFLQLPPKSLSQPKPLL